MKQNRFMNGSISHNLGIHSEHWQTPIKQWADYAESVWKGKGRVEEVRDAPEGFIRRATRSFTDRDIPVVRLRTWVNVMLPDSRDGYDTGYPHVHHDDSAVTLIHYLRGAGFGQLDIFDRDEVVLSITPKDRDWET